MMREFRRRPRRPRLTLDYPLPDGVRRQANFLGEVAHETRQRDGSWTRCNGPDHCDECMKEEAMKTTIDRLREALEEHFGYAHLRRLPIDANLFADPPAETGGRTLGDITDRYEMYQCVEAEFAIALPDEIPTGAVTLESLGNLVDSIVATRDASPH